MSQDIAGENPEAHSGDQRASSMQPQDPALQTVPTQIVESSSLPTQLPTPRRKSKSSRSRILKRKILNLPRLSDPESVRLSLLPRSIRRWASDACYAKSPGKKHLWRRASIARTSPTSAVWNKKVSKSFVIYAENADISARKLWLWGGFRRGDKKNQQSVGWRGKKKRKNR